MKIITVCQQGINRSVTAKWLLQFHPGNEVIAAGLGLQQNTLKMLYDWADRVILLDADLQPVAGIPDEKLVVWDVGPDRFEHHFNKELLRLLRAHAEATEWPSEMEVPGAAGG